jgi:hypothetical protein
MRHRGTRRTHRRISELEAMALLRALSETRTACRQAMASAPIKGDAYRAAGGVLDAIDAAAETLTGKPGAFLPRPHGRLHDSKLQAAPGETTPPLHAVILAVLRAELY